jgi:hypothetical protein
MTGRGLMISTTTKSSQIIGHVHGWIVGCPERVKESQKAQQRAASMRQGIYDEDLSNVISCTTKLPGMYLKVLPVVKTSSYVQIFTVNQR